VTGLHSPDPLTLGAVTSVPLAVAALALFLPARLVARVDPAALLKKD